jgi:hypothetical protein
MVIHGSDIGVTPAANLPQRSRPVAYVGKYFRRRGQEPVDRFATALIFGHQTPRVSDKRLIQTSISNMCFTRKGSLHFARPQMSRSILIATVELLKLLGPRLGFAARRFATTAPSTPT